MKKKLFFGGAFIILAYVALFCYKGFIKEEKDNVVINKEANKEQVAIAEESKNEDVASCMGQDVDDNLTANTEEVVSDAE